jgi:hypothetical protein
MLLYRFDANLIFERDGSTRHVEVDCCARNKSDAIRLIKSRTEQRMPWYEIRIGKLIRTSPSENIGENIIITYLEGYVEYHYDIDE